MIELSLLQHFVAVAQSGSFTRAAAAVHAHQSVITRSIKRLEAEIGATLFERTTRAVKLTPAGEAFLAECKAISDRLEVATADARRISSGEAAELRVGICPSTDQETIRIAQGLAAFRAARPGVNVKFTELMRNSQAAALRASQIDIGLMRLYHPDCRDIRYEVIARDPLLVAVPAIWGMRQRTINLAQLRHKPWLIPHPEVAPDMHQLHMELCRGAGFEPIIAAFTENLVTAKLMLACGLGASFANDPGALTESQQIVQMMRLRGVSEHFCSETVVAWAASSRSTLISEFARSIADARAPNVRT